MLCESVMVATILSPPKDNQYFIGCGSKDTCNPADSSDTAIQSSLKELRSSDLIVSSRVNYAANANHQGRVYETHRVPGSHSDCSTDYFNKMDAGKCIDCVELSGAETVLGLTTTVNDGRNACGMDYSCGMSPYTDGSDVSKQIDHYQQSSQADRRENGVVNSYSGNNCSAESTLKRDTSDEFPYLSSYTFQGSTEISIVEEKLANCSEIKELGNMDMIVIQNDQVEDRNSLEEKVKTLLQPEQDMDANRSVKNASSVYKIERSLGEKKTSLTMEPLTDQCATDEFSGNPTWSGLNPDRTESMVGSAQEQNAKDEDVAKDQHKSLNMPSLHETENEISQTTASVVGNNIARSNIEKNAKLSGELQQSDLKIEERFSSEERFPVVFKQKSEAIFSKGHIEASVSNEKTQNPEKSQSAVNIVDEKGVQNSGEGQVHRDEGSSVELQDHTAGGSCDETQDCAERSTTVIANSAAETISFVSTSTPNRIVELKLAHEIEEHRYLALSPQSSCIVEPSHSLRELLTTEDQLQGQKDERLPATPRKIGRGTESSSYRSSATGSDGVNSHESSSFPQKWYEDADDDEVLSGPIAFSGALTHSGLICQVPYYSGSISHRSDSSTSTRSFAFPILASDFSSSPVKRNSVPDGPGRRLWRKICRSCLCTCWQSSTMSD